ncbi:MAG: hypothetical protein R3B57_01655 [Phycisphaerales bacterium]
MLYLKRLTNVLPWGSRSQRRALVEPSAEPLRDHDREHPVRMDLEYLSDGSLASLEAVFDAYMSAVLTEDQCREVEAHLYDPKFLRQRNHWTALFSRWEEEMGLEDDDELCRQRRLLHRASRSGRQHVASKH